MAFHVPKFIAKSLIPANLPVCNTMLLPDGSHNPHAHD